ncbi:YaaC family protein [Nocardioides agariphilus]|uniref:YaaC family protein n=1 Tax=Nocardioides agariphilus TaxID=433664 RepID=UPI001E525D10|nr:YaaC family protein [Nocardioides agariphilus]
MPFSFFMMRKTTRRWGAHSILYAAEPWGVIARGVRKHVQSGREQEAASSFVRQAREYFTAAERAATIETRPLLYYYSFLNLGKALSIVRGRPNLVGKVHHGIGASGAAGHDVSTAELACIATRPTLPSAVDELHRAIEEVPAPRGNLPVRDIIPQSVVAHRMWREAVGTGADARKERFLATSGIELRHDPGTKEIWSVVKFRRDTLQAQGRGHKETLDAASFSPDFDIVQDSDNAEILTFEQSVPVGYTDRPADKVMDVVHLLRSRLWQTVIANPPYRKFYVYLSAGGEVRLPHWYSIYATTYWLGSLTRYQPVELLENLNGEHGAFFTEFLATQPNQLLYLLASEFIQQDVTHATVV